MRLELHAVTAALREPFVSARGSRRSVALLRVSLIGADGVAGHGEAIASGGVHAALEQSRAILADSDGQDHEQLLAASTGPPAARAAIDLALWDLAGRRMGLPLWRLLEAAEPAAIDVNATIAAPDRAGAAAAAAEARAAGFGCVKVKVALGDDAGRVAAVRAAAGAKMAIRLDANGAWSVDEAVAALRALEPANVELCEQPAADVAACARVAAASAVPVSLDESALAGLQNRACQAVCLKIASCGGISGVLDAARLARQAGYRVYMASLLDGPLGIAAALHAAAVIKPDYACGLATLALFDGAPDPLPPSDGQIALPTGPGLGAGLLDWYAR